MATDNGKRRSCHIANMLVTDPTILLADFTASLILYRARHCFYRVTDPTVLVTDSIAYHNENVARH
jgi:hypothetical protein